MAFWSTKAAISLKRVKIQKTLLWEAYRNSPSLFRTVPSPTSYGLRFPKIGVPTPPKTPNAIISGTGEATNFKFGRHNNRSIPTKAHGKFWRNGSVVYSGTAQIFCVPSIISGTGKATDFKFGQYIRGSMRTKVH